MSTLTLELVLFILAAAASAWFSAVEIALTAANPLRLRHDAREGSATARLALEVLGDRERVLATTLVGINLSNITAASVATGGLQRLLEDHWRPWQISLLTTGGVTLVLLLVSEITPKSYAKQRADRFLITAARPVLATEQLLLPVAALVRGYLALLLRLLGRTPRRPMITRDELKILVHDVKSETGPSLKEKKMLRSALDFRETTAREVMLPMSEVVSIEREGSADLLRTLVRRYGFTRLPVYERRVDRVIGLVNVFDLLFDPQPDEEIARYIREPVLVPETKRIDRLMAQMQRERQTMAVVVSEFGSCIGIVTMEDIVEEIVGELSEEHEVGTRKIRQLSPRSWVIDALTDIDDVNEELGLELPKGKFDTINGLVLRRLGHIPAEGESFVLGGVEIEVVDAHRYGVRSVKLTLRDEAETSA